MRTIIGGTRKVVEAWQMDQAIEACGWYPTVVLTDGGKGAAAIGEAWARMAHLPIEQYLAAQNRAPLGACYRRNLKMVESADAIILFDDGLSDTARKLFLIAMQKGIQVFVYQMEGYRVNTED